VSTDPCQLQIDQRQRSTFGNPLDELNRGARAASFPFVGKHEPCRIRAESVEGLFVAGQNTRFGSGVAGAAATAGAAAGP